MENIRFRAWDKEKNEWIDMSTLRFAIDGQTRIADLPPSRYILMQSTGIKDKNGKEIFEGDILDSEIYPFTSDGNKNYLAEVNWDKESASFFGYVYQREESKDRVSGIATGNSVEPDSFCEFEVIGNIYEIEK